MAKKLSYWARRAVEQEAYIQHGIDPVQSKIAKAYLQAQAYLTAEVKKLFNRARLKNDMTEDELKKALNESVSVADVATYKQLAKQIETAEVAKQAQKRLNILAMKSRITRLEDLRAKSYLVAKQVADVEYQEQTDFYIDAIHESYKNAVAEDIVHRLEQRGITFHDWKNGKTDIPIEVWNDTNHKRGLHEFKELSTRYTKNILESHWKGSNYSQRIWGDTDKLAKRLEELFTVESMSGMSQRDMVHLIAKEFNTSIFVANRLIRTEANYMAGQANLKAWRDREVEKYQIVAVLDLRTSNICRHQDKKVYLVKDARVGVNMHPFHPHCRSIARAYYGDRITGGYVIARDPITGKDMKIPRTANYDDWMKELLKRYNEEEIEKQKKLIRGR